MTYPTKPGFTSSKRGRRGLVEIRYGVLAAGDDIPVDDCLVGVDNNGNIKAASTYTSVATFANQFAGFCPLRMPADANNDRYMAIYIQGNIELDCDAASFKVGQSVDPVLDGGNVSNKKCAPTTVTGDEIGVVVKPGPYPNNVFQEGGATTVEVAVANSILKAGWIPS